MDDFMRSRQYLPSLSLLSMKDMGRKTQLFLQGYDGGRSQWGKWENVDDEDIYSEGLDSYGQFMITVYLQKSFSDYSSE